MSDVPEEKVVLLWRQILGRKEVQWLNQHWEWYFAIVFAVYAIWLTTHLPYSLWLNGLFMVLLIPNPGWFILGAIVSSCTRTQIAWRMYGWVWWASYFTWLLGPENLRQDSLSTNLEIILAGCLLWVGETRYPEAASALVETAIFLVPFGMVMFWTRGARVRPIYDLPEE